MTCLLAVASINPDADPARCVDGTVATAPTDTLR
jgi:hypothetical protein